jgi:hypothetical protein
MHLIDLTFGAGGLALYLLGLPTVCSYMGAKHAYGFALQHGIGLVEPATVVGVEPGEWANAHNMIAREDDRVKVIEWLRRWRDEVNEHLDGVEASGRDRFDRSIPCPPYTKVKLGRVPEDPHRRAAAFLFLQGVNYKSKAVYVVDTADGPRWHTDGEKHCLRGLAKTAPREATGERAGSKGFGAIVPFLGDGRQEMNPSRPVGLVQRLEAIRGDLPIVVHQMTAQAFVESGELGLAIGAAKGDAVVCIDHDYDGTTGYGSGSYPLADVIDHLSRWRPRAGPACLLAGRCQQGRRRSRQGRHRSPRGPGPHAHRAGVLRQARGPHLRERAARGGVVRGLIAFVTIRGAWWLSDALHAAREAVAGRKLPYGGTY